MRLTVSLLLFLLNIAVASAQLGRKELVTDTGTVVLHHFDDGSISTREWVDKEGHWGRSIAYDRQGRIIYNGETRSVGGHASVHFSYHPNGGISKAAYSSAPDGGIQWHKSTTTFNEAGEQTGYSELGRDNYGIYPRPTMMERQHVQEPVVKGQRMFVNEVFLVNATRSTGKAEVRPRKASPAMKDQDHTIAPGDTIRLGTYSMGEVFPPPHEHVVVTVKQATLKKKDRVEQGVLRTVTVDVQPEHRRYYLVITKWKR